MPKLVLETSEQSLPATVLLPRLEDTHPSYRLQWALQKIGYGSNFNSYVVSTECIFKTA
jgi:hypothetical protein